MKPLRFLLVAAALGLLAWGAFTALRRTPPAAPVVALEMARTNLVLVEGRLCLAGGTNAFTGFMTEHTPDGGLLSRSAVSNGLLHGLSLGYHTNGQAQVSEHFRDGVSHGVRTKWYASGAKHSEATVVDGKLQGTFRRWHENGRLAEQLELVDGQPDGEAVSYFPSGHVKARVTLQAGKILAQNFYPDGE